MSFVNKLKEHIDITEILDSITDGFFVLDKDWNFVYVNLAFEKILGRDRNKLLGKNIWDEFPEAVALNSYTEYHRAMKEKTTVHFNDYFFPKKLHFSVTAYPKEDGLTVYFQDITGQKEHEMKILEQNRVLNEIASLQSHEIRSNVAAIMGLVGLFDKNTLSEENLKLVNYLETASNRFDAVIQKVVDKSRGIS